MLLIADLSEFDINHVNWFRKHRNDNPSLSIVSKELVEDVSKKRARQIENTLPTCMMLQVITLLNKMFCFGLKNISVIISPESFFLNEANMPDDEFHRNLAFKFYGARYISQVTFENIHPVCKVNQIDDLHMTQPVVLQ